MRLRNFIKLTKQKFLLWFTFCSTVALFPLYQAKAFLGILEAPFVLLAQIATGLIILCLLSFGFLSLGQITLNWASSPDLIGGITTNAFVLEGWRVVRDFSNLFFILILVIVGVATALRIKQYEIKKIFPRLIIVALLINFSPVICGLAIDAANIVTNFFLTAGPAGFGENLSMTKSSADYLIGELKQDLGNWSALWRGIWFFKLLFVTVFNFFGGFVLFLLGLLFLMRNLILWILVILSPLAFLSFILPATKKVIFDKWRKEFIQWCFIGVGAAFFIYLSQLMLHLGVESLIPGSPATEVSEFGGAMITRTMIMAVPFIFLMIGYFVTISTSATGATGITNLGKGIMGGITGKTKALAWSKFKEKALSKIPEPVKKKLEEWSAADKPTGAKKAFLSPYYWMKRKTGQLGIKAEEEIDKAIDEAEKEVEKASIRMIVSKMKATTDMAKKIGYLNRLVKKPGDLDDAFEAGLSAKDDLKPIVEAAQKRHREKDIFAAAPHLAKSFIKPPAPGQTRAQVLGKEVIGKIKPGRAKLISKDALKDPDVLDAIVLSWNKSQFAPLLSESGPKFAKPIENRIITLSTAAGQTPKDWLEQNNKPLHDYLTSTAGKGYFTIV